MKRETIHFILIVVLGSLTLTACKKSGNDSGTYIKGVAARPQQEAARVDTKSQKTLSGEEDEDSSDKTKVTVQQKPATEDDECMFGDEDICTEESDDAGSQSSSTEGSIDKRTKPQDQDHYVDGENEGDLDSNIPAPGEIASEPSINTEIKWLARQYTGAAEDAYRDHLMALMASKMSKSPKRDEYYSTAESITRVKAFVTDGVVQVSVDYREGNLHRINILGGPLDTEKGAARLQLMNKAAKRGNSTAAFGSVKMSGTAVCADRTKGSCNVLMIRLVVGSGNIPVWILARSTNSNLGVPARHDFGGSSQAALFHNYYFNTNRQLIDSVQTIFIESFEVIHGISGMKITAIMNDNEVVSAQGLLLAPKESILTNVEWSKSFDVEDLVYMAQVRSGFKSGLQNSVKTVRLITNDGHKEFTLNYSFGDGGSQDVTYSRIQPSILDINEMAYIFKAMKVNSEL